MKNFIVALILLVSMLTGCTKIDTYNPIIKSNKNITALQNNFTEESYKKILKSQGSLDNIISFKKEFCVGYLGDDNILVNDFETNILQKVNITTGDREEIIRLINYEERYMCAWKYSDGWFVWSEDSEKDLVMGTSIGKDWVLKAVNIYSKQVIEIDKEPKAFPKDRTLFATPISFSVDGEGVVYKSHKVFDNEIFETISYFDFKTRNNVMVEKIPYEEKRDKEMLDTPYVFGGQVFYGRYQMAGEVLKGNIYVYDIESQKTKKINEDMIFEPIANEKYIIALKRTEEVDIHNSILIMDNNGEVCNEIKNEMYDKENRPSEFAETRLSGRYLVWRNIRETQLNVFDTYDFKMYEIFAPESGREVIGINMFDNNFLLWAERTEDGGEIHNYAILN